MSVRRPGDFSQQTVSLPTGSFGRSLSLFIFEHLIHNQLTDEERSAGVGASDGAKAVCSRNKDGQCSVAKGKRYQKKNGYNWEELTNTKLQIMK